MITPLALLFGVVTQAPRTPRPLVESAESYMPCDLADSEHCAVGFSLNGDINTVAKFMGTNVPLMTIGVHDGRVRIVGQGWSVVTPTICPDTPDPRAWPMEGCRTDPALAKKFGDMQ
jgi:hypothetical protein